MLPIRPSVDAKTVGTLDGRSALFRGEIVLTEPVPEAVRLADAAQELLTEHFAAAGLGDPRLAHARFGDDAVFPVLGAVRKEIYTSTRFHLLQKELLASCGFAVDAGSIVVDPPRLRIVHSGGHHEPRAQGVYRPHRDTWYAHPASLIVGWVALNDLPAEETFVFFKERFDQEVPNDSELFAYEAWGAAGLEKRLGWQKRETGLSHYPGFTGPLDPAVTGAEEGFAVARGGTLWFAGAHFHRTLPRDTGRTRFSLDFRVVNLNDHATNRGAPMVDARCSGSALVDYVALP